MEMTKKPTIGPNKTENSANTAIAGFNVVLANTGTQT